MKIIYINHAGILLIYFMSKLTCQFITKEKDEALRKGKLKRNDIVLTTRGTVGNVGIYNAKVKFEQIRINSGMVVLRMNEKEIFPDYIFQLIQSDFFQNQIKQIVSGSAQPQLPIRNMSDFEILLPPFSDQQKIANRIEKEQQLVNANKELIKIYEQKIKDEINKLWQAEPKQYSEIEEKINIAAES